MLQQFENQSNAIMVQFGDYGSAIKISVISPEGPSSGEEVIAIGITGFVLDSAYTYAIDSYSPMPSFSIIDRLEYRGQIDAPIRRQGMGYQPHSIGSNR